MVSSDLCEFMQLCGCIGVIRAGWLTYIFRRGDWNQDALLVVALGELEEPGSHIPRSSSEIADAL